MFAGVVAFRMGTAGKSGNNQSKDATATLMSHPGGRWLILLIGLVVTGAGVALVVGGVRKIFLKQLNLAGLNPRSRRIIETLGTVGTAARGIVFGAVGVFLVVAAVSFWRAADPAAPRPARNQGDVMSVLDTGDGQGWPAGLL
ncbi:MAG: hypothetical protein JWN00_2394 [Actinomycetia bacterium]|nr:hypothetical protein [Actinomycetes bacterium]